MFHFSSVERLFVLRPLQNPKGSLKSKMERRRLVAKWLVQQNITDLPRCRRAADAPLVAGLVKVSGCLAQNFLHNLAHVFGQTFHGGELGEFVSHQVLAVRF